MTNRLQELAGINEIKVIKPDYKRHIYAICDDFGHFEQLLVLKAEEIIEDDKEGYDGLYFVIYKINNDEEHAYYLEKIII